MRLRFLPAICLLSVAVIGCGSGPSGFVNTTTPTTQPKEAAMIYANPTAAGDMAYRRMSRIYAYAKVVAEVQPEPRLLTVPDPSSVSHPAPVTATALATSYPYPVSSMRCPPGPVKDEIRQVFGGASDWAESVAFRESNCTPNAVNSSGSTGIFQLMMPMHSDLISAACPGRDPMSAVYDSDCNIRAAYALYQGSGTAPWAL